jgi:hypothetical protein
MKKYLMHLLMMLIYSTVYLGVNDVLWPWLAHFHHHEWRVPAFIDGTISSVGLPFLIAWLLAGAFRRIIVGKTEWLLLITPFCILVIAKYLADAFYPPFLTEFSSLLIVGLIQGLSAFAGWFVARQWAAMPGRSY